MRISPALNLLPLLSAVLPAQQWADLDDVPQVSWLLCDAPRQRLLAVCREPIQTWSFDGTGWVQHNPDGLDQPGLGLRPQVHLAGYDEARGRGILVPSALWAGNHQTFATHGAGWRSVQWQSSPTMRSCGVSFDPINDELVVFGGMDSSYWITDAMHAWDGSMWLQHTPAVAPSPRQVPAMATDRARQRIVLFGGEDQVGMLGDTWEWDGTSWTQRSPASAPAPRTSTLGYDPARQRTVLLGGTGAYYSVLTDCWEWDGAQWTSRGNLPEGSRAVACDDGSSLWIVTLAANLWRANGAGWSAVWRDPRPLDLEAEFAFCAGSGEAVLVTGRLPLETRAWNGSWQLRSNGGPAQRLGAAMAPLGNDLVLFGGADPAWAPLLVLFDHTWHFDGTSWAPQSPANRPPARRGHAMAGTGGEVLLFGGRGATGELADTWTYDGTTWTQRTPSASPPPRQEHAMTYDPLRQRALLCGGRSSSSTLYDTWEWDGTAWTSFATTLQPQAWHGGMTFDGSRPILLSAGEILAWTGADWIVATPGASTTYFTGRLVFDPLRQRVLMRSNFGSLHLLGPTPAIATTTDQACGNDPDLRLLGRPGIGSTPSVHLEGAPNTAAVVVYGLQPQWHGWAPWCDQHVAVDAARAAVTDGNGLLDVPLALPFEPTLRGLQLHAQAVVLDGGPVFGASLTGALHLLLGD